MLFYSIDRFPPESCAMKFHPAASGARAAHFFRVSFRMAAIDRPGRGSLVLARHERRRIRRIIARHADPIRHVPVE